MKSIGSLISNKHWLYGNVFGKHDSYNIKEHWESDTPCCIGNWKLDFCVSKFIYKKDTSTLGKERILGIRLS